MVNHWLKKSVRCKEAKQRQAVVSSTPLNSNQVHPPSASFPRYNCPVFNSTVIICPSDSWSSLIGTPKPAFAMVVNVYCNFFSGLKPPCLAERDNYKHLHTCTNPLALIDSKKPQWFDNGWPNDCVLIEKFPKYGCVRTRMKNDAAGQQSIVKSFE